MSNFTEQVGFSADDASEQGTNNTTPGAVSITQIHPIISGSSTNARYVGFRFRNVTIPQGVTISAATIRIFANVANTLSGTKIYCEAADNSAVFTTASSSISSRAASTHSTIWTATLTASSNNTSPDISAAVNDVISRAGWVSGNSLTVIFDDGASQPSNCSIEAWDGNTVQAAQISITYTAPVAVVSTPPLTAQMVGVFN